MADPLSIIKGLIQLNLLENEFASLGDRSKRKAEVAEAIEQFRTEIPTPILAHHNRIRARGRQSTSPVRDWICRSCFIAVPIGMRTHLVTRNDIHVCENCGSYMYHPDGSSEFPDDMQLLEMNRKLQEKSAAKAAKATAKSTKSQAAKKATTARSKSKPAKIGKLGKRSVSSKLKSKSGSGTKGKVSLKSR